MRQRTPIRSRHPAWLAAVLFILALCAASVLAEAAESAKALPDAVTSMQGAAIEGTAPADDPSRIERWNVLREAIFGSRQVLDGKAVIRLEAPVRAFDAALVPLTLSLVGAPVKGIYLVIDNNPSPLAGHLVFGPKADTSSVQLRVRVNEYTLIHAVAEAQDGKLYGVWSFVKAAGGCSAPAGADESEAMSEIGRMKLRVLGPFTPGKPVQAQLLVRHPNFNGMQMNQITRMYTPPRFIKSTDVTYEGASILHLDSDISMSTDPVITFGFVPRAPGALQVHVEDSEGKTFTQTFPLPEGNAAPAAADATAPASPVPEPADFWTGPINSPVPATLRGGTVIGAAELAALLKKERAVIVDVSNAPPRPEKLAPQAVWLPPPHATIPGAVWLSGVGAGVLDGAGDDFYRRKLLEATSHDLDRPIVVYCHERCWLSWNAAKRAVLYGYTRVYWFADGIEGWRAAGFTTVITEPQKRAGLTQNVSGASALR